ncbi:MAG: hypothetical protein HKN07_16075 [Acidimicrobiia bacterium]|nr:hypothetical protein [Acidimicrobiia bacterium]NNF65763.1 hypothetical protein [Acidimicrobiia bacterium]
MSTETWWWITLGVGLVVAVVVWVLLHLLYRAVVRIDKEADTAWESGKRVARNTATAWMLGQTARIGRELKEEALRHDALLEEATK